MKVQYIGLDSQRTEKPRCAGYTDIMCRWAFRNQGVSIAAAYSNARNISRCIVHQIRNTLKYVSEKDNKAFAKWSEEHLSCAERRDRL